MPGAAEILQMAPPVSDEGSARGVRTTIFVVNWRGRSGSAPYQADLSIENRILTPAIRSIPGRPKPADPA